MHAWNWRTVVVFLSELRVLPSQSVVVAICLADADFCLVERRMVFQFDDGDGHWTVRVDVVEGKSAEGAVHNRDRNHRSQCAVVVFVFESMAKEEEW